VRPHLRSTGVTVSAPVTHRDQAVVRQPWLLPQKNVGTMRRPIE
jgi:hypothetical protein